MLASVISRLSPTRHRCTCFCSRSCFTKQISSIDHLFLQLLWCWPISLENKCIAYFVLNLHSSTFTILKPLLTFQPHYLLNRVLSYAIDVLGMLNSHRPYCNYTTRTQINSNTCVALLPKSFKYSKV